jgi:hypothetical protein
MSKGRIVSEKVEAKLARMLKGRPFVINPRTVRSHEGPRCPACYHLHRPSMVRLGRFTTCRGCGVEFYSELVPDSLFPWETSLDGPSYCHNADTDDGGGQ